MLYQGINRRDFLPINLEKITENLNYEFAETKHGKLNQANDSELTGNKSKP